MTTKNKRITFTSNHEDNVNTNTVYNPTYYKIGKYDVVSIFKRKKNSNKNDGNPLVYALKGQYGWTIDNSSLISLIKNGLKIVKKIDSKYDTIICIPSSSELNSTMMRFVTTQINHTKSYTETFRKIKASDVFDKYIDTTKISDDDFQRLQKNIKRMIKENDNIFSFKYLDKELRRFVNKAFELEEDLNPDDFNNKDVLIIDDIIASGSSFNLSINAILETFNPRSITILSLFSPLED